MSAGASIFGAAITGMDIIGSAIFNEESYKLQKENLKLQKKQYDLNMRQSYTSALETLAQIAIDYENSLDYVQNQRLQLSGIDEAIGRFDAYYSARMADAQAQGLSQYQQGMANWQNQQVMLAEKGLTGSTASLLSAMQRQSLVNFVGEDLIADAEGGTYGMALRELMSDMDVELTEATTNRDILDRAIRMNEMTAESYKGSIQNILKETLALGYDTKKSYDELAGVVDQYRQYLGSNDEEYQKIKSELLQPYTPLDYRVTSYKWETESGGESQHGATIHEHTGYITWVKDKDTGLWGQATSEQVKELKKVYGKNYLEDYIKANEVVEFGQGTGGMANNVRRHNGSNTGKPVLNDATQKYLESLGSRPK